MNKNEFYFSRDGVPRFPGRVLALNYANPYGGLRKTLFFRVKNPLDRVHKFMRLAQLIGCLRYKYKDTALALHTIEYDDPNIIVFWRGFPGKQGIKNFNNLCKSGILESRRIFHYYMDGGPEDEAARERESGLIGTEKGGDW